LNEPAKADSLHSARNKPATGGDRRPAQ
jgi:hypothetical protein